LALSAFLVIYISDSPGLGNTACITQRTFAREDKCFATGRIRMIGSNARTWLSGEALAEPDFSWPTSVNPPRQTGSRP
jgi:hypothetical protein